MLTEAQKRRVEILVARFTPDSHHTIVGSFGLPDDWVTLQLFRDGKPPYVLGICPEGRSYS